MYMERYIIIPLMIVQETHLDGIVQYKQLDNLKLWLELNKKVDAIHRKVHHFIEYIPYR